MTERFTAKNLGTDVGGGGKKKKRDPVKFGLEEGFLSLDDDKDGSSEDEQKVKGLQGIKKPPYLKQSTLMVSINTAIGLTAGQQQRLKGKNNGVDLDNLEIDYEEIERLKGLK
ncbi:hypothetical protein K435DRAFT_866919 [Dendrothele bispora CBS 962.96]|uniref:Uncharacterized protein n=1 Tax=Dendrothele bispora (strain CBS 962.96) TaxID=1314807 RepID=A0A4S8LFK1_DENBC|nr:hypothetical protein K435DRAFT_866919 [Dendrothele bispora CBS 962.96]